MSAPSNADAFELNLTPLLDVVLQLIMFFMVCVKFTVGNPNVLSAETDNTSLRQAINDKGKLVLNLFVAREITGYDSRGRPIKTVVTEIPGDSGLKAQQITVVLFPDPETPEIILVETDAAELTSAMRRDVVNYLRSRNMIHPNPPDDRKPPIVEVDPEVARVEAQAIIRDTARHLRVQAGRAADDRSEDLKALAVLRVDQDSTCGLVYSLVRQFRVERMQTEVRVVSLAR